MRPGGIRTDRFNAARRNPLQLALPARRVHRMASIAASFALLSGTSAFACSGAVSVCERAQPGSIAVVHSGQPVAIYVDAGADPAVRRVAASFAADLQRIGGKPAPVVNALDAVRGDVVIIGVPGQSPAIDGLVKAGKLRADDLKGRWEAFRQIVVENPAPGIRRALVIAGSDRRGAVFGTYDLSEKLGISPWYWWADVPVKRRADLYVTAGQRIDQPKVRYRGLFINDEDPAFKTWAERKFGGVNSRVYEHVFELNLRLKANYIWPAMWGKAFGADDPRNIPLADEMGVIMGTSHHEPMMRAQAEWHRNKDQGVTGGAWDYTRNGENLRKFWRGGIERMAPKGRARPYDSLVTLGMRGDGDEPMTEGTATQLLETIVADQRKIIAEVTGKPAAETPQMWALYKEVQDYYDQGMKVPDDVLLLFADDNWGQIRRLPVKDRDRKGGYGVYYHFDYVGGPRNYKWLNNTQIEKVWQQMDLANRSGADDLWIVNVGDIKPMEFPLSFFLDMAWNPDAMTLEALRDYPRRWAEKTFGAGDAAEVGALITRYSQLAARRKPELINADSFPLGRSDGVALDGGEFGRIVAEWDQLERSVLAVKRRLRADQLDAYFQVLEHPATAMANLYRLYYAVAWNRRLAAENDPRANGFADLAEAAYRRDAEISDAYHKLGGGKWDGMMLQVHIGYTNWQQPDKQTMPEVRRVAGGTTPASVVTLPGSAPLPRAETYVSIDADSFTRTVSGKGLTWRTIPHLGRTSGAIVALPQGQPRTTLADNVRVEYDIQTARAGDAELTLYMVPTLDVRGEGGVQIAVSIDDRPAQTLRFDLVPHTRAWDMAVSDNAIKLKAKFPALAAGKHSIKVWRIDGNAVLQKLVLATGPVPAAYLGPLATIAKPSGAK